MIRIPLLFVNNSISPKIIPDLVRSVDIFPTLCELAKINFKQSIHGRSLVSIIQGSKFVEKPVYLHTMPYEKSHPTDSVGIRTGNYKYFRSSHNSKENVHLYDLKKDPQENNNITKDHQALVEEMEKIISDITSSNSEKLVKEEISTDEEEKISKELKKLGYM